MTMRIAIASGKGGTGKTTVAVNLACVLADSGLTVQYLDCDVEEPNGHIFLKPTLASSDPVGIPVPVVDEEKCTGCRKCAEVCRYGAIAVLTKPLVFSELCHGCGGCAIACPPRAIREELRTIGVVETGRTLRRDTGPADGFAFVQGRLHVGEPMAPPLIRAVKKHARPDAVAILDAPPGTSCPVVATVRDADVILLVTEPTPFGIHDLQLAAHMVRPLNVPCGVVINRAYGKERRVHDVCAAEKIPVLLALPDDRRVAEAYSRGQLAVDALPEWSERMRRLWQRVSSQQQTGEFRREACG